MIRRSMLIAVTLILLTAAAGAGKTAVLAARCEYLLTGPARCGLDELLILTFTRDAAAGYTRPTVRSRGVAVRLSSFGAVSVAARNTC